MCENKNYIIRDNDGNHEYNLIVEETEKGKRLSLHYSSGRQWVESVKGTIALSMTNTGNSIKFDRKFKRLDYDELLHVRLLINFEHLSNTNPKNIEKYLVIEDKTLIEI